MATGFWTGLGANLVTEFVKLISGTIKQQVFYVFKHSSYVNDLNDQVEELNRKRQRVESGVDRARRQGDEIYEDVGKWLERVKQFIEQEANPITENEGRPGTCSLITWYKVGRKAVKAAKAGSNLLGKDFSDISYRPALQRTESMYVDRDYEAFDSRESILAEIMEALEDPQVNRMGVYGMGVYGMGGVGKTTLVKKVAGKAKEDKLFDDVVMVEVTEKPDYKRIQDKIAYDMGLVFELHESEFERAGRIRNRLKKGKRVLVILDNIWAKLNLEAIGIPLRIDHEKGITTRDKENSEGIKGNQTLYKILVTSRRQDVLRNYMSIDKNFCVETLSYEEAQNLFWKIVGYSTEKVGFCDVAQEIVGKCEGLPLAVQTIANALKNKDLYAWEDALGKLKASDPRSIPEMNKDVVSVIELSFNLLDSDEAKSLFLLIGLYHASDSISHDYLMRYSMGLGLFKNVYTLEQGRNRVDTLVHDLKASCLLLEGGGGTSPLAKMHEVVHAVAVSIASTDKLWFNIQELLNMNKVIREKISKNPIAISLHWREVCQLPERLECPKLELFFLFTKFPLKIPNDFFEGAKELKVIDMDHINLTSIPSSFGYLANLRTLCLDECLLGDVSIIGELTNLEILSFSRSNIEWLPREIGRLTRLQLLDLSQCSSLKIIPTNVITRLSQLEELDLEDSFVQWEDQLYNQDSCNASLAELNQLSHLTSLSICIPDAQIIPLGLFIEQLKRFKILMGDVWDWSYRNEVSTTLKLKLNNTSYLGYKLIIRLLKITEDLYLDELKDIQNILYELDKDGFPKLKYLHVQNGYELLYIVNSIGQIPYEVFRMLEILSLNNLTNLVKICHGPLTEASFKKLKVVKVNKCDKLKHLFSISMAKSLSQLEEIEVIDCKNLQVIFDEDDDEGHVCPKSETNSKIELTQLRFLTLESLPQFTNFSFNVRTPSKSQTKIVMEDLEDFKTFFGKKVAIPNLEKLAVCKVDNLQKIWDDQLTMNSFSKLKELMIDDCCELKNIFPSIELGRLQTLQSLIVSNCESLVEIIESQMLSCTRKEAIVVGQLRAIHLQKLPKLKHIWNLDAQGILSYEKLNSIEVRHCDNLKYVFPASIAHGVLNLENLRVRLCMDVEEIVAKEEVVGAEKELISEKVFPNLKGLILQDLPKLKRFCNFTGDLIELFSLSFLAIDNCPTMKTFVSNSLCADMTRNEPEEMNAEEDLNADTQPLFDEKVSFPNLEILLVGEMDNLRKIWDKDRLNLDSFSQLREIFVGSCSQLLHIFPSIMHGKLQKLEELEIWVCDSLEEILELDALSGCDEIVFKELKSLKLAVLPRLRGFYLGICTLKFPSLDKVTVLECSMMETFSRGIVYSPKLQRVQLAIRWKEGESEGEDEGESEKEDEEGSEGEDDGGSEGEDEWCWKGDLNTTVQHLYKQRNAKTSEQD